MCEFVFRHFFTVVIIVSDIIFVEGGDRVDGTFQKNPGALYSPWCTVFIRKVLPPFKIQPPPGVPKP
jgi:hypothetical protein